MKCYSASFNYQILEFQPREVPAMNWHGMVLFILALTLLANASQANAQTRLPSTNPQVDSTFEAIPYSIPSNIHAPPATSLWRHPDIEPPQAPPGWFVGMQINIVGPA